MVDGDLAAADVVATVFVMNDGGRFHRRNLLAEARRHLVLVLRSRRRDHGGRQNRGRHHLHALPRHQ
ncbi:hypothetical protein [Streptomyces pilosus]|uniref:hypothetical protein n=1 Tax=Streptomyces pilosus TaxID=28893 RepID=UPI0016751975|nr:hypothetical protein [Streptomyces pilosus]